MYHEPFITLLMKMNAQMFELRSDPSSKEYSPIFLQFLESVEVIRKQHPQKFQFNENFLPAVSDVFHAKCSTAFAKNCDRERRKESGLGIYEAIEFHGCLNAKYIEVIQPIDLIRPNTSLQSIPIWKELYMRHNIFAQPYDSTRSK